MTAKYSEHSAAGKILRDPLFWGPLAAAGVGAGVSAAQNAIHRMREARERAASYKEMLELHPHLRKSRDPAQVQRLYRSLHNIAPVMAKDPLVAGAWVDNIVEQNQRFGDQSNQALLASVKDMAGIRSSLSGALEKEQKMRPDLGAVTSGAALRMIGRAQELSQNHNEAMAWKAKAEELHSKGKILDNENQRLRQGLDRVDQMMQRAGQGSASAPAGPGAGRQPARGPQRRP